jgi:hypothetical protein
MAYSHTLDLVQGDTNPQLTLTLRDANKAAPGKALDAENSDTWAVIVLTGGTVKLKLRLQGEEAVKDTLNGVLTDPENGRATFLFNPTTLDTVGTLEGEVEFTDPEGRVQTVYDLIRLRVRAQF